MKTSMDKSSNEMGNCSFAFPPPSLIASLHTNDINKPSSSKKTTKNKVSSRKLALKVGMSRTSARWIIHDDLDCRHYKYLTEPTLTDEHNEKR